MSHNPGGVSNDDLECLSTASQSSQIYHDDIEAIAALNDLCKRFGYGLIPHLAERIEGIWRNPEARQTHLDFRVKFREAMSAGRRIADGTQSPEDEAICTAFYAEEGE